MHLENLKHFRSVRLCSTSHMGLELHVFFGWTILSTACFSRLLLGMTSHVSLTAVTPRERPLCVVWPRLWHGLSVCLLKVESAGGPCQQKSNGVLSPKSGGTEEQLFWGKKNPLKPTKANQNTEIYVCVYHRKPWEGEILIWLGCNRKASSALSHAVRYSALSPLQLIWLVMKWLSDECCDVRALMLCQCIQRWHFVGLTWAKQRETSNK